MLFQQVFITSDHAGFDLKKSLADALTTKSYRVILLGARGDSATDYPDDATLLSHAMAKADDKTAGIAICGSGIGIAIALNRYRHLRAALCRDVDDATLARQHNHANVLVLAGRKTSLDEAIDIATTFLQQEKNGNDRHVRRVKKLS